MATSKNITMKQFNRVDYDTLNPATQASQTSYDNSTTGSTATTVQGVVDELFISVSNGKSAIASAITNKGVSTSSSDSFDTMATNIGTIPTGTPRSKSDVTITGNNATIPSGLYGSQFSIAASELCNSGTKSITTNGTGIDVTGYSEVNVNVPSIIPSGTFLIKTEGTYDVTNYASVIVDIISSTTPGDTINWDNKTWLVCHYDSTNNRVYLIAKDIVSKTSFGSSLAYAGSTLASVAAAYQSNNMSAAALAECVDVTVNGVTAKVFVPSSDQMLGENGVFSWFNSDAHRIANYGGAADNYWTSSTNPVVFFIAVRTDGVLYSEPYGNDKLLGFRPCICVQL